MSSHLSSPPRQETLPTLHHPDTPVMGQRLLERGEDEAPWGEKLHSLQDSMHRTFSQFLINFTIQNPKALPSHRSVFAGKELNTAGEPASGSGGPAGSSKVPLRARVKNKSAPYNFGTGIKRSSVPFEMDFAYKRADAHHKHVSFIQPNQYARH